MTRPDGTPLEVRVGVNTGEARCDSTSTPGSGEGFLTGDAVNVAARLQAAAPPMGVAVGALTHELSQRAFVFEELPPVVAKGKADPIEAWLAAAPVARRGLDTDAGDLTPLVGREVELAYLSATFEKVSAQASPQLVLLVGEPGIGKSRLVRELLAYVDSRPAMTTWRQGYCPPFGEDVTYWALSEIVKGHAGIRDTDESSVAEAKLEAVVPPGSDREWLRQRLRALVGLAAPDASREENFTAWMRFFEEVAAARPTILVFEDLHWADEALLAFLEHLATHLASVPLMVVGTARPELFERRPGFASGGRVNRVGLAPLSRDETERLVAGLMGEPDNGSATVSRVVERCDGNPFYAEQSARLLADSALAVTLPDSVQAVIAARLDTLPADQKALLADAAVVGSVFWDGAVATMGGHEPQDLEGMLSGLLERQMIRRIRETSMEGDREYAFVHALAREVAYAQLPRAAKARKHAAAAAWMEAKAGEEPGDLAEVLAHHYSTALEFAKAGGQTDLETELTGPALRCLIASGKRALRFDFRPAEAVFRKALDLAPPDHPLRPSILSGLAQTCSLAMRFEEAGALLDEAIPGLAASGDVRAHMWALMGLNTVETFHGREAPRPIEDIVAALEADGPSEELVEALTALAGKHYIGLGANLEEWTDACERAIAVADEINIPSVWAKSLLADWHLEKGDLVGLTEFEDVIVEARSLGLGEATALLLFNFGCSVLAVRGAQAQFEAFGRGLEFATVLGSTWYVETFRMGVAEGQAELGLWDEALAAFAEIAPRLEAGNDLVDLFEIRCRQVVLLARRGELAAASELQAWIDEQDAGRFPAFLQTHALLGKALVDLLALDRDRAAAVLRQWRDRPALSREPACAALVPDGVRTALECGDVALAESICSKLVPKLPLHGHALASIKAATAATHGEHEAAVTGFADAATGWHDFGVPYEEAQALLGQGRCLVALERPPEAAAPLAAAREIFARLGAKPALAETEAVLAAASVSPETGR